MPFKTACLVRQLWMHLWQDWLRWALQKWSFGQALPCWNLWHCCLRTSVVFHPCQNKSIPESGLPNLPWPKTGCGEMIHLSFLSLISNSCHPKIIRCIIKIGKNSLRDWMMNDDDKGQGRIRQPKRRIRHTINDQFLPTKCFCRLILVMLRRIYHTVNCVRPFTWQVDLDLHHQKQQEGWEVTSLGNCCNNDTSMLENWGLCVKSDDNTVKCFFSWNASCW